MFTVNKQGLHVELKRPMKNARHDNVTYNQQQTGSFMRTQRSHSWTAFRTTFVFQ